MKFKNLLKKHCTEIVQIVLDGMQPSLRKVSKIKPATIPKEPILYRWWFPNDSVVVNTLRAHAQKNKELINLLIEVETREIERKTYLALYFGKSNKGYRRFIQHTTGNVHTSTIRHTIYGLCISDKYNKTKEKEVSAILDECYFEWYSFKDEEELVECLESLCIAIGKYPLNVEGNPAINNEWRETLMSKRKID